MAREVCGGWFVGKLIEECEVVHLGEKEIIELKDILDKGIETVTSSEERMRRGAASRGRERARSAVGLMSERLTSLSRSAQPDIENEKGDDQGAGVHKDDHVLYGHGKSEIETGSSEKSVEDKSHKRDSGFFDHHSHSHPHTESQDKQSNTLHPQGLHVEGKPNEKEDEPNNSSSALGGSMEKKVETLGRGEDGKGGKTVGGGKYFGKIG